MTKKLSKEYIIGLIEGQGSFKFTTWRQKERRIPTFELRMSIENEHLIELVRDAMGLPNKVYTYRYKEKDSSKRKPYVTLLVREIGELKNIIVPTFYNQLVGSKRREFDEWIDKIGSDPWVPESYRIIYRLHENGYYKKNTKNL